MKINSSQHFILSSYARDRLRKAKPKYLITDVRYMNDVLSGCSSSCHQPAPPPWKPHCTPGLLPALPGMLGPSQGQLSGQGPCFEVLQLTSCPCRLGKQCGTSALAESLRLFHCAGADSGNYPEPCHRTLSDPTPKISISPWLVVMLLRAAG